MVYLKKILAAIFTKPGYIKNMARLLIVDDAPFIREVIKHQLQDTDVFVVGEAADGEEAVLRARDLQPDIILMDLVMPNCNGLDATRRIHQDFPETRILACSTEASEEMVFEAMEAGCCDFIAKPFTSEQLLFALRGLMRRVANG